MNVCPELWNDKDTGLQYMINSSIKLTYNEQSLLLWIIDTYTRAYINSFKKK